MPTALQFVPHDPIVHEYQIDGTDSTSNFTLDPVYLNSIASSPYYRFQTWMRDLDGTSRWRDLRVLTGDHLLQETEWPANGVEVKLPSAASLRLSIQLQRPETAMTLNLITTDKAILHITLDRNNRRIAVTCSVPGKSNDQPVVSTFFPIDPLPFAVMVIDALIRTLLWAVVALLVVLIGEVDIVLFREVWPGAIRLVRKMYTSASHLFAWRAVQPSYSSETLSGGQINPRGHHVSPRGHHASTQNDETYSLHAAEVKSTTGTRPERNYIWNCWRNLTDALHPIALVALGGSLLFVAWIANVQYQAEPHIYDASAYFFTAKMYALGHLSVPLPHAVDRFPGPFMVQFNGQWFGQYAPGTSLTLVPGIWLGVPWIVEPLLGTFALLGIGLIAVRLYDQRVATLAVILGTLSPFYSYLAASYLSHAIALFYLTWGLWALLRFAQGKANWNLALSAVLFGMAGLTRDLETVLFVAIVLPGVLLLSWRRLRRDWSCWVKMGMVFLAVALLFVGITMGFNASLTGSPWVTPRSLYFAGDHWGFGLGVGFYGQHTLAAGFVNLNELLTILQIDLFGWPFYLTLVFLTMPFLTRRAVSADWLMLAAATILTSAYAGYFYHGIYLGPRYLFETIPFLLVLTARGILTLATTGLEVGHAIGKWIGTSLGIRNALPQLTVSLTTVGLLIVLVACNLLYFMPRQIALHQDYTGLPRDYRIDVSRIYHPSVHNAIVVTGDYTIYQFVLFPLNDPMLHDDIIYAWADNPSDYTELRTAFPGRTLYRIDVRSDGSVQYVALAGG